MQKDINLLIHEIKDNILNILNTSGLPISVLSLIMKEITQAVLEEENRVLQHLKANVDDVNDK